jgi:hypothetical protein
MQEESSMIKVTYYKDGKIPLTKVINIKAETFRTAILMVCLKQGLTGLTYRIEELQ